MNGDTIGYIHSFTTGSAYDGPGLRTVVWTTGCQFRCVYCHNPDTWHLKDGQETTADALVDEIAKYAPFMKATGGGVTISGGEPLVQADFVMKVLRECKARGLHTTLDTNGALGDRLTDEDLKDIDLVLLDLKSWDPATHREATRADVAPVLKFARRLAKLGRPVWIRFVLVPSLTDAAANVDGLAEFVATLPNVERVEILPFHQLGRSKWERRGITYPMRATLPPTREAVEAAMAPFQARGVRVYA